MVATIRLAISLILAATFLVSGVAKIRSGRFVADLADYKILPVRVVVPVATWVPYLEFALAAFLVAWSMSAIPIYLASGALVVFAAAMIVNLVRGRAIACGCRGSDKPISWSLVVSNLTLAVVATGVATYQPAVGGLSILEGVATAGCVAVAGLGVRLAQQMSQIRNTSRLFGLNSKQALP